MRTSLAAAGVALVAACAPTDGERRLPTEAPTTTQPTDLTDTAGPGPSDTGRPGPSDTATGCIGPSYDTRVLAANDLDPGQIVATDLDGDGDADALLAAYDQVVWYANLGGGQFGPQQVVATSVDMGLSADETVEPVAAADLDGDGDRDVLAPNPGYRDHALSWYENLGGGTFGVEHVIDAEAYGVSSLAAADLDGDDDPDALAANWLYDLFGWYENLGGGAFGPRKTIAAAAEGGVGAVAASDLDGDGDLDVLGVDQDAIRWFENLGAASFGHGQIVAAPAFDGGWTTAPDIDGDGDPDVLSASVDHFEFVSVVAWYENVGDGAFGPERRIAAPSNVVMSVDGADLDGDGDTDVLSTTGHSGTGTVAWYQNVGGGSFGPPRELADPAYEAAVFALGADLDGDGRPEVLAASHSSDDLGWHQNLGGGSFGPRQLITAAAAGASSVLAADLDGDADVDALWSGASSVGWFENLDGRAFESRRIGGGGPSARAADLDGDGDLDVTASSSHPNETVGVVWYANLGGGEFGPASAVSRGDDARMVFPSDLDGDGDTDVLWATFSGVAWAANLGNGTFLAEQVISTEVDGATSVAAADLDADGDLDVLSTSYRDDKVAWYENVGGGVFGSQRLLDADAWGAYSVHAADLDADGDPDVLSAAEKHDNYGMDSKVSWYENHGGTVFGAARTITVEAVGAVSVFAADLDGDGDPDVLSAAREDDEIAWYENLGGAFGPQRVITLAADWAASVDAADLSGDGHVDVVSASLRDGMVAWYEARPCP